jgi:type III pantothenate kinase
LSPDPAQLLAIDAGNTRIKWGVGGARQWRERGAIATARAAELAESLPVIAAGTRAIASNVAGADVHARIESACAQRGVEVRFIRSVAQALGITNGYRDPAQLGTDRWAGVVAAHHAGRGHKLVVNAGTALTIDALASDGRFLGGLIVPGPALMARSLDHGTAALRAAVGAFAPLPTSTPDAITTGAIQAAVGAIGRMIAAMGNAGMAVELLIVSGGAAGELEPHLPMPASMNENLVLDGLALLAHAD